MEKDDIEVGQIWEVVTDSFFASKDSYDTSIKRDARFHLEKGEKIEIRYPFAWNYRTERDEYFHSKPQYILDNCKLIGVVKNGIRFKNRAKLEEIIRLELFDKI